MGKKANISEKLAEFTGNYIVAPLKGMTTFNDKFENRLYKRLPVIFYLILLLLLSIGSGFHTQHLYRKKAVMDKELLRLQTKETTLHTEYLRVTRESNIIHEVKRRNIPLEESVNPPKLIGE